MSKPKYKKTFKYKLVTSNRNYSLDEIVKLFGVHRGTIQCWLTEGLKTIDKQKPYLVMGYDLKEFIKQRQNKRKIKCQPYEFYCLKCKAPRISKQNKVIVQVLNLKLVKIIGQCGTCNTQLHRMGSFGNLSRIKEVFLVEKLAGRELLGNNKPSSSTTFNRLSKNQTKEESRGTYEP